MTSNNTEKPVISWISIPYTIFMSVAPPLVWRLSVWRLTSVCRVHRA